MSAPQAPASLEVREVQLHCDLCLALGQKVQATVPIGHELQHWFRCDACNLRVAEIRHQVKASGVPVFEPPAQPEPVPVPGATA